VAAPFQSCRELPSFSDERKENGLLTLTEQVADLSGDSLRLCVSLQETQPIGERNSRPFISKFSCYSKQLSSLPTLGRELDACS